MSNLELGDWTKNGKIPKQMCVPLLPESIYFPEEFELEPRWVENRNYELKKALPGQRAQMPF